MHFQIHCRLFRIHNSRNNLRSDVPNHCTPDLDKLSIIKKKFDETISSDVLVAL